MSKKDLGTDLKKMIEEKRALEGRIEGIKMELTRMPPLQQASMASGDARVRLESFIMQNGGNESNIPESRRPELRQLQSQVEEKSKAARAAKERDHQLREELEELKGRLGRFEYGCSQKELLDYLRTLEEAEGKTTELRAAIAKQEEAIRIAEEQIPSLGNLPRQREDLLADIATGQATAEALKEVDDQIEQKNKEIAKATASVEEITSQARQAIAGLNRKLAESELRASELREELIPHALVHYLGDMAEIAAENYIKSVEALRENLRQVVGIGSLLQNRAQGKDIFLSSNWSQFRLPGFALKACQGAISDRTEGSILCIDPDGNWIEDATRAAMEELQALGFKI